MNQKLQQLLSQVYELEGLLHVAANRGEAEPYVTELIKQKISVIADGAELLAVEDPKPAAPEAPAAPAASPLIPIVDINDEPEIPDAPDDIEEPEIPDVPDDIEEPEIPEVPDDIEEPEHFPDDIDEPEYFPEDPKEPEEPEEFPEDPKEPEEFPEDPEDPEETEYDVQDDSDYSDHSEYSDDDDSGDSAPQRLGDRLERDLSRDLRRAFTLNDRFRFRRELFENSDVQMNETLDLVDTMTSFEEAEEYFYGDCGWDKESQEVHDFMEIISRHFK